MVDQELLGAIGAMMDEKLEKAVAPIHKRLDKLEQGQNELKGQMKAVEERIGAVEERIGAVEERIGAVEERLGSVEESLEEVRGGVNTLLEWADDVAVKVEIPLRPAQ